MANCEKCSERATKILSVGSLGITASLCERHVAESVRQLEPNLVPFHLTGIDAPFTGEASLSEQVNTLDDKKQELLDQLDDARHENQRLRDVLLSRLQQQNDELRTALERLQSENETLADQERDGAEAVTRVD